MTDKGLPQNRLVHRFRTLGLLCIAVVVHVTSWLCRIPGGEFGRFGWRLSLAHLLRGNRQQFINWFVNPVSITRYFEFPFVWTGVPWGRVDSVLDVSSPCLFSLYLLARFPHLRITLINLDDRDLAQTKECLQVLGLINRCRVENQDAIALPYPDESFDAVYSISVLEHIPGDGDAQAIRELWRVLKVDGTLTLTIPFARETFDRYREGDVYQLQRAPQDAQGRYFFERIYDADTLQTRLIESIGTQPERMEFLARLGRAFFFAYEQRWIKYGLYETVKDPWYVHRYYRNFSRGEVLHGLGVVGLTFRKHNQ